jgi:hypothetical protein
MSLVEEILGYGKYLMMSGCALLCLGVLLMFDGGLLALGNIQLVVGLMMAVGPTHFVASFLVLNRLPFTLGLFLGFGLVLAGWPVTGLVLQIGAIFALFKAYILSKLGILRSLLGVVLAMMPGKQTQQA